MAAPQDRQNERTVGSGTLIPQINLYDKANKVAYFGDSDLAASSHIDFEKYGRGNPLLGESEKPARALLAALTTLLSLTVVAFLTQELAARALSQVEEWLTSSYDDSVEFTIGFFVVKASVQMPGDASSQVEPNSSVLKTWMEGFLVHTREKDATLVMGPKLYKVKYSEHAAAEMLDSSWGDVETAIFGPATSGQETEWKGSTRVGKKEASVRLKARDLRKREVKKLERTPSTKAAEMTRWIAGEGAKFGQETENDLLDEAFLGPPGLG
ncbi:hypothetical protein EAH_00002380 [Eimeria acervulina]|uniref:Uncharacterized protein n=1 Tax=Eimeria acervulina TaxID=5801 RepID=U6GIS6_EIMAC|nr:hypothetical protein EAH_00002380 [Eimeria acervulina]CDI80141.1 hypothetical protein EAH_00002380 [Eimeria acervulina]